MRDLKKTYEEYKRMCKNGTKASITEADINQIIEMAKETPAYNNFLLHGVAMRGLQCGIVLGYKMAKREAKKEAKQNARKSA